MRRLPQRSCIGCRTVRAKPELVRIVHTPDDRYVLDPAGKVPGRGAYVCPTAGCLETALKRKGFDRAFRGSVPKEAAAELAEGLKEYLRIRAECAAAETDQAGSA